MKTQWGTNGDPPAPMGGAWFEAPSLRRILAVFFRRWREIMLVFVLSLLPVALLPFVKDPVYEVTAAILVTKQRAQVAISPTEQNQPIAGPVTESDVASELELLISR